MIKISKNGLHGITLYCSNHVNEEVTEGVKAAITKYNEPIYVSFDVIGRTCHSMLGYQLADKLGEQYEVTVAYNYYIKVKRREV